MVTLFGENAFVNDNAGVVALNVADELALAPAPAQVSEYV